MKRMILGNSGRDVSGFCLGTMLMGTLVNQDDSFAILDDFVSRGGDFLDTANNYAWWLGRGEYCGEESEKTLGAWMESRDCRSQVFLATKLGARQEDHMAIRDSDGIPRWDEIPDHLEGASEPVIRREVQASLNRLRTEVLDLLYIHVDDRTTDLQETLGTLADLVRRGVVRHIGYSNIQTWRLEQVFQICKDQNWPLPVAVQMEYSYVSPAKYGPYPLCIHAKEDLFDWIKAQDGAVNLVAYSPVMKGIYGKEAKREALLQQDDYDSAVVRRRLDRIARLAERTGLPPNVLVLAWMAARNEGIVPIIGFSQKAQYLENTRAFDVDLDDAILEDLNQVG